MCEVEELRKAITRIRAKYKVHAILLFGSRARGNYKPWSDYDILVIGDFREKYLDRIGELLKTLEGISIEVELHPYTLEEALNMLKKGNPLIIDAIEEGKLLYKDEKFEEVLKEYRRLKRLGLSRSETSIILP